MAGCDGLLAAATHASAELTAPVPLQLCVLHIVIRHWSQYRHSGLSPRVLLAGTCCATRYALQHRQVCKRHGQSCAAADANDDDDEDEEELDDEELDDDADFEEESEAVEGGEVDGSVATDDEDGDADGDDDDDDEAEREYIRVPAGLDPTSFYCSEMQAVGLPKGKGCPTKESLLDGLNCQVGFWVSKKKLQQDVRALRKTGIFAAVDVKVRLRGKSRNRFWSCCAAP